MAQLITQMRTSAFNGINGKDQCDKFQKPDMLISMKTMASASRQSDWKACWGILWRSLVFMPYMLAIFIGVGSIWLSRWVLPVCAALLIYSRDWMLAALTVALWFLTLWSYRRFHLSRFYEPPPSLL